MAASEATRQPDPPPGRRTGPDMWALGDAPATPDAVWVDPLGPVASGPAVATPEPAPPTAPSGPSRLQRIVPLAAVAVAVAAGLWFAIRPSPEAPPRRPPEAAAGGAQGGIGSPDGSGGRTDPGSASPTSSTPSSVPGVDAVPVVPRTATPKDWRVSVRGPDAARLLEALGRLAEEHAGTAQGGTTLKFATVAAAAPGTPAAGDGAAAPDMLAVVESGGAGIRLVSAAPAPVPDVERPDALVPIWFAGDVLAGVRLPMRPDARPRAAFALCLLLAQDAASAFATLADVPDDLGVKVLEAYAAVSLRDFPATHRLVKGIEADPEVGPIVRFLIGAALFGDGETRESTRDFVAAAGARPGFWPATLYAAAANHRLGLREEALAGYDAVLAVVPGRVEAMLGRAACLARTDRPAALEVLKRLVRDHPDLATAWSRLAALYREEDHEGADDGEVDALVRYTALRPHDREAWERLAIGQWARGRRGGGPAALRAAADSFGKAASIAKGAAAAMATYSRGAVLHQWALLPPPDLDVKAARERLAEAKSAYESALALGLAADVAAQAHFNGGLAIDQLAASDPAGGGAGPTPPAAIEEFQAAQVADPTYAPAALALVGARLSSGAGGPGEIDAASKALRADSLSAAHDSVDLFSAAIAALRGEEATVRAYLEKTTAPGDLGAGDDAIAFLAERLTAASYPRVARAIVGAEPKARARLSERVRADARLWDAASARSDLARLDGLDPAAAAALRSSDAVLRAVLAP